MTRFDFHTIDFHMRFRENGKCDPRRARRGAGQCRLPFFRYPICVLLLRVMQDG